MDANPTVVDLGQSTVVSWSVDLPTGGPPLQSPPEWRIGRQERNSLVLPAAEVDVHRYRQRNAIGRARPDEQVGDVEVPYPPRVVIDPSTPSPVQVLVGALVESTNPQQTVEMCDVDLDLTGFTSIVIGDNRSLIASPGCERGPRRLGRGSSSPTGAAARRCS